MRRRSNCAGHFTIFNVWLTLVRSAANLVGVIWCSFTPVWALVALLTFPRDDSTIFNKIVVLLVSPSIAVGHGAFGIMFLLQAVRVWTAPHKLMLDNEGRLVFRSAALDRIIAIESIVAIELVEREEAESRSPAQAIRIRFSGGKLVLPRFAERERVTAELTAINPTIGVVTLQP